jgi:type I restriction enzyme S subunit
MALIRPNRDVVDPRFLLFTYLGPDFQSTIEQNTIHGATVNRIPLNRMNRWEILLPSLREQQAIAEVLGALDDKIAANTNLVAAADRLADETFDSIARTDELPLSSTAQFVNGRAFTKDASGTGRVVVRIAELNSGLSGSTVRSEADVDDRHVARSGDILFAWSGSLTLHRWFRDEAIVNQHIFKVIPESGYQQWLVFQLLHQKLADFKSIAADKATTMGHIQRHHLDTPVTAPSAEAIASIDTLLGGLWTAALAAERENEVLAATRDALLPKLMSGKLRVRDAEAPASAAGA